MTSFRYSVDRKMIVVTVISDLVTDYRVHKICQTLHNEGYRVHLIGSSNKRSLPLKSRDYQTDRIKTWFNKSALFYAEFNIRLFFRLLRQKPDIFLGNDLDVMPATMLNARFRKKPVVYDSHEFFLGMAGMDKKPIRRNIWKFIETRIFARLKYMYTVSESIRNLYQKIYHEKLFVVRNLPLKNRDSAVLTPEELNWLLALDGEIPQSKHLLIFQGAGINEFRGAEELVLSMKFLDASDYHLLIVGGGDVFPKLEEMTDQHHLWEKITLIPKLPFNMLSHLTRKAQLGISIDKSSVLNHKYSLPNKLFEYLHAGVPVLASRLIEQEAIINQFKVGDFIEDYQPEHIAAKIKEIFANPALLNHWKQNTCMVRETLNWENESKIVIDIFKQVERDLVNT
jgi:glycosyltransferase involved in cell wall biosynthesis